jgi:tetratricopeptide (TPR) repeat protein
MAFGSEYISKLRADWDDTFHSDPPFSFWSVAGERDEFVSIESSLEPFAPKFRAVVPGNHLDIVKPQSTADLSFLVLKNGLLGSAAPAGPWNSARVAVETRRHFEAIQMLEPNIAVLDEGGLVMLALAYEGVGRTGDAIQVLEAHGRNKLDAMGTLAGRLKRRWISERRQPDLDRALQLYGEGLSSAQQQTVPDQIYYHAINVAFLHLATGATELARKFAEIALAATQRGENRKWSEATAAEARLILRDNPSGIEHYRLALDCDPTPREIESMYRQAVWIAELLFDTTLTKELDALFRPEGIQA